jgi:hypothetical protein
LAPRSSISHRLVPQPPRSSSCGVDCTSLLRARTRSHQLQAHLPSGKASEAEGCRRRLASHPITRCSFTDQDHSTGRRQHTGHPSQIAGMSGIKTLEADGGAAPSRLQAETLLRKSTMERSPGAYVPSWLVYWALPFIVAQGSFRIGDMMRAGVS